MPQHSEVLDFLNWLISLETDQATRRSVNLDMIIQRAHSARNSMEYSDNHVVNFTAEGWTLLHPLACRPNLFECAYTKAKIFEAPEELGTFTATLVDGEIRW